MGEKILILPVSWLSPFFREFVPVEFDLHGMVQILGMIFPLSVFASRTSLGYHGWQILILCSFLLAFLLSFLSQCSFHFWVLSLPFIEKDKEVPFRILYEFLFSQGVLGAFSKGLYFSRLRTSDR